MCAPLIDLPKLTGCTFLEPWLFELLLASVSEMSCASNVEGRELKTRDWEPWPGSFTAHAGSFFQKRGLAQNVEDGIAP